MSVEVVTSEATVGVVKEKFDTRSLENEKQIIINREGIDKADNYY